MSPDHKETPIVNHRIILVKHVEGKAAEDEKAQ